MFIYETRNKSGFNLSGFVNLESNLVLNSNNTICPNPDLVEGLVLTLINPCWSKNLPEGKKNLIIFHHYHSIHKNCIKIFSISSHTYMPC